MIKFIAIVLVSLSLMPSMVHAQQLKLAPYKEKLFAYPKVLDQADNGDYINVAYNKQRDIYGRDRIPLRKAKNKYVTSNLGFSRRVRKYKSPNGTFKFFSIGRLKGANVTVIYLYGQGGNRFQGVNDWTFGGNFNRLQVLMKRNGGLLATPDYSDFNLKGAQDIASLMVNLKRRSPKTRLIIACGSMGGKVCWQLAQNKTTSAMMDGMFILGSLWNDDFLKSATISQNTPNIPIYFGHGSWDPVFKPEIQKAFYRKIRRKNPSYPLRFVMFDTGKHGTPIRMVDWRRELNWMLSLAR